MTELDRTARGSRLKLLVLVAVGGFAGSNFRHLVSGIATGLEGTLLVNTTGSFLLGVLLYVATSSGRVDRETRAVLSTGFLASFTTYSTFAVETVQATPLVAVGNVAGTYGLGFTGVLLSRAFANAITGEPDPGRTE